MDISLCVSTIRIVLDFFVLLIVIIIDAVSIDLVSVVIGHNILPVIILSNNLKNPVVFFGVNENHQVSAVAKVDLELLLAPVIFDQ